MCGRVDIHDLRPVKEDVKKYYDWNVEDYIVYDTLGYNIPPSTEIPVWYERNRKGILQPMRWGLIPHWAREKKLKYSLINARSEEIKNKPAYREGILSPPPLPDPGQRFLRMAEDPRQQT